MGTVATLREPDRSVPATPSAEADAWRRHTFWVLGLALTARAAVVWYAIRHFGSGWFFTRGLEMGLTAQSLLEGHGLSSPFGVPTGPTAIIAPGYPLLVAAVFRVFGSYSAASSLILMGLHVALNVATAWLILHLARGLADERSATLAGTFWACSLPTLWMPTIFWETNLSAFLLLGLVAAMLSLREHGAASLWLAFGAFMGAAGLVNPALLPCMGALLLWGAWPFSRTGARKLAFAGIGFLLLFSAWPVRNAHVFGTFIPARTTVGFELWMGNRPAATGFLDESLFPSFNRAELLDYQARGEVAYMRHKGDLARAFMRNHPAATLRLTAIRIGRFWSGRGTRGGAVFFALHAVITTVLGGLGLLALFRAGEKRLAWLFLLPAALFPLPYYVTHAEFRYRLVLDPVLCVLAARGWATLRRTRAVATPAAA